MKKPAALFLILTLCLCLLSGCGKDEIPTEDTELWVMTELTEKYRMNDQAERVIAQFEEMYPNVTVKLDILPTDAEEREVYLYKLRTQIMAGTGPDVYLMPTYSYVPQNNKSIPGYKKIDLLFQDVEMAMYNGLFCDISEYYDADEALNKEELNTAVMDGGVLDGARYVLPLRYDYGVYLVDRERFERLGGDIDTLAQGVDAVMEMALETEYALMAYGSLPNYPEYCLGDYLDVTSGEVLVTDTEIAAFLRNYRDAYSLTLQNFVWGGFIAAPEGYIGHKEPFATMGLALYGTSFSNLLSPMATAKVVGEELEMYPMLDSDGALNAVINYYAAVGAGCDYPRLAYEFIRLFLSEEMQYETYMTTEAYSQADYSAWYGWPVRTAGSVEARYETLLHRILRTEYEEPAEINRQAEFNDPQVAVTDADIPALNWEIDAVQFPISEEITFDLIDMLNLLIDHNNDYAPTDVDIDALAKECIEKLQLHLNEG